MRFVIHDPSSGRDIGPLFAALPDLRVMPAVVVPGAPGRGCALSHQACIKAARDAGAPWVHVLEDDCVLTPAWDLDKWMAHTGYLCRSPYHVLNAGVIRLAAPGEILDKDRNMSPPQPLMDGLVLGGQAWATHCVVYKSTAYEALLNHTTAQFASTSPGECGLRTLVTVPFMATQAPGWSAIACNSVDYATDFVLHEDYLGRLGEFEHYDAYLRSEHPEFRPQRERLRTTGVKAHRGRWRREALPAQPERVRRRAGLEDVTKEEWAIVERVRPYTCTSIERIVSLCRAVRHVTDCAIPGAIVECGVWKGGSTMAAMLTMMETGQLEDCWQYDTYRGMPPAGPDDVDFAGTTNVSHEGEQMVCRQSVVEANLLSTGYPVDLMHIVAGMVEDTIPRWAPDQISVLRLDTDWYQSTKHELTHLWPRLSPGGVLLVDDYGHWRGARKAVDEYFANRADAPLLSRIDYTGRIGVKR